MVLVVKYFGEAVLNPLACCAREHLPSPAPLVTPPAVDDDLAAVSEWLLGTLLCRRCWHTLDTAPTCGGGEAYRCVAVDSSR